MGVKYTLPFRATDDVLWRLDMLTASYSGTAVPIRGVGQQCVEWAHDVDTTDDPFSTLVISKLTINLYNQGEIDVDALQTSQDKDWIIELYRNGFLKFRGYLDIPGIQEPLKGVPCALTLTATDGLDLLADLPYVHADLPGTTPDVSKCPMNYIRQILFSNLGIILPIRWNNDLKCTAFESDPDVYTGQVRWAYDGQGYNSYQTTTTGEAVKTQTCGYILSGILAAFQSRIYQENGMWIIRRIPQLAPGTVVYKQIDGNLGVMTVATASQNLIKHIGRSGYRFAQQDQVKTVKAGFKSCTITYNANKRDNILPNGNLDDWNGVEPFYWGSYDPVNILINQRDSLDGRQGSSAEITNTNGVSDNYFTLISTSLGEDGLDIDTKTLIKKLSFGFLFEPIAGFPLTGDLIDWTTAPFKIQVIFNAGVVKYYLNEFGFWQTTPVEISIVVDGLELNEVAKIAFDAFQGILMPEPDVQPAAGDISNIQVIFKLSPGQQYGLDNVYLTIDSGNDVYESTLTDSKNTGTDTRELNISSSFGGYIISNFMTRWNESHNEFYFRDGLLYTGSLTGLTAAAIMRYRYKSCRVYNGSMSVQNGDWSFDEIYTIDTLGQSKFLPLNSNYNIEKGIVSIVAMELRNDNVTLTEKYYNSNDNINSN